RDIANVPYPIAKKFGPFPYGNQLKEVLKLIKKIFPFFDLKEPIDPNSAKQKTKLRTSLQIGLYPDIYSEKVSKREYALRIKNIINLFEGKMSKVKKDLSTQMKAYAKEKAFEKADEVKKTLFALEHIRDISLIKEEVSPKPSVRIEAYDISH